MLETELSEGKYYYLSLQKSVTRSILKIMKSNDFEELLNNLLRSDQQSDAERTAACPSETALIKLISRELSNAESDQLVPHIAGCSYCATFIKDWLQGKIETARAKELTENIFAYSQNAKFEDINELILYSIEDGIKSPFHKQKNNSFEIEIKSPGTYQIRTGSGLYIWSHNFSRDDLVLTKEDMHKLPLAADMKEDSTAITSISEPLYDGRLHIRLIKGSKFGTLEVSIVSIEK
jgi:hypothetical protein